MIVTVKLTEYTCRKCSQIIDHRDVLDALGHQYHTGCFVCSVGDHQLSDQEPYYEHKDLKIYCQTHFDQLDKGDACAKCGQTLDTEFVQLGDKSYHAACWTCKKCDTVIQSRDAVQVTGGFYCRNCAKVDVKIHSADRKQNVVGKRLVPGYGDSEVPEGVIPPSAGKKYPYRTLRQKHPYLPREVDTRQKEQYLTPEEFIEVFGVTQFAFSRYPTWKRLLLKKEKELF